jgi:hypothetical protein
MIVLNAKPLPPQSKADELLIEIAVRQGNRSQTGFVGATAYIDPGADLLCLRDEWLARTAEPSWRCKLMLNEAGEIGSGTSFFVKIGSWVSEFRNRTVVTRSSSSSNQSKERFKTQHQFILASGTEDVLLGANFLAPLLLVYDNASMTLIDPRADHANRLHAERIRRAISGDVG